MAKISKLHWRAARRGPRRARYELLLAERAACSITADELINEMRAQLPQGADVEG